MFCVWKKALGRAFGVGLAVVAAGTAAANPWAVPAKPQSQNQAAVNPAPQSAVPQTPPPKPAPQQPPARQAQQFGEYPPLPGETPKSAPQPVPVQPRVVTPQLPQANRFAPDLFGLRANPYMIPGYGGYGGYGYGLPYGGYGFSPFGGGFSPFGGSLYGGFGLGFPGHFSAPLPYTTYHGLNPYGGYDRALPDLRQRTPQTQQPNSNRQ